MFAHPEPVIEKITVGEHDNISCIGFGHMVIRARAFALFRFGIGRTVGENRRHRPGQARGNGVGRGIGFKRALQIIRRRRAQYIVARHQRGIG